MVVKNEEDTLARCLESVKDHISEFLIVDTGSTDGTKSIVSETLVQQGIPGEIVSRKWQNFGHNRTQALKLAQKRGKADWWLMLDADMTVFFHENLLEWLNGDPDPDVVAWKTPIHEEGTNTSYLLPLLIRANAGGKYVGVTHEYLLVEGKQRPILGLNIEHHHDGVHRPEKFERDLKLLAPGVKAKDPRAIFYTAECYRCLGDTAMAIRFYKKRAEMGGWDEEVWYSQFRAAALEQNIAKLLKIWKKRPHRCEPLLEAARIVSRNGTDDVLFVESP
jgi:glycosyltransferase involved in cell wall biosynthesis